MFPRSPPPALCLLVLLLSSCLSSSAASFIPEEQDDNGSPLRRAAHQYDRDLSGTKSPTSKAGKKAPKSKGKKSYSSAMPAAATHAPATMEEEDSAMPSSGPSVVQDIEVPPTFMPSGSPTLPFPPCVGDDYTCIESCLPFWFLLAEDDLERAQAACSVTCPCIDRCYRETQDCNDIWDACISPADNGCLCLGGREINDFYSILSFCGEPCGDVCTNDMNLPSDVCATSVCPCAEACLAEMGGIDDQQACANACLPPAP